MDISVSRLINRMVLQVPAELPLGLVFIVGRVGNLEPPIEGVRFVRFDLVDGSHRLRCQLPSQVARETLLKEGDQVRVGGHLAFDRRTAQYQLVARDLEIVATRVPRPTSMQPILADVKERSEVTAMPNADLPPWVKELAPPEIQKELGLIDHIPGPSQPTPADLDFQAEDEPVDLPNGLPTEMISFLSGAIDSNNDIELTPEMIAEYLPDFPDAQQAAEGQAVDGSEQVDRPTTGIAEEEPASGEEPPAPDAGEIPWDEIVEPTGHAAGQRRRNATAIFVLLLLGTLTLLLAIGIMVLSF